MDNLPMNTVETVFFSYFASVQFGLKWRGKLGVVTLSTSSGVHQCPKHHEICGWLVSFVQCPSFPPKSLQSSSRFHSIPPWMSWSTSDLISCPPYPNPSYVTLPRAYPRYPTQPSPSSCQASGCYPVSPSPIKNCTPLALLYSCGLSMFYQNHL